VPAAKREIEEEAQNPNMRRALVFGVVTALLCSALWYYIVVATDTDARLMGPLLGFMVAREVTDGAGWKRGRRLQLLSTAITIGALALNMGLIMRYFALQVMAGDGAAHLAWWVPLGQVWAQLEQRVLGDSAYLMLLMFVVIEAYLIPKPRWLEQHNSS
jgi:hypothetical protein